MDGIFYLEKFLSSPTALLEDLKTKVIWDERMRTRKTASFGKAYNYSQMIYPYQKFPSEIEEIIELIESKLHFSPNNCLINYYENGNSVMGFHSDQTNILQDNTGIVVVSLGATRTLRFRKIEDKNHSIDFSLVSGSLFYMTGHIQKVWQHAVIKSETQNERLSLTFRKLK